MSLTPEDIKSLIRTYTDRKSPLRQRFINYNEDLDNIKDIDVLKMLIKELEARRDQLKNAGVEDAKIKTLNDAIRTLAELIVDFNNSGFHDSKGGKSRRKSSKQKRRKITRKRNKKRRSSIRSH